MELEVTCYRSVDAVQDRLPAWDRLVERHPLRGPEWLLNWWDIYRRPSHVLNLLLVHCGQELVGLAPLYRQATAWGHRLRFLGSGDVCTDHTTLFAHKGQSTAVGKAVAGYLLSQASWQQVHFEFVDQADSALQAFHKTLQTSDCVAHSQARPRSWQLTLPPTWEAYLGMLSKSHRKRCRRLHRAYVESGRIEVVTATEANFDHVWETFLRLHTKRWGSPRRPSGVFTDRRFRAFHERVSQSLLARDQLRLCYLTCDGTPLAAEYQFIDHDTLYAYQSGMDPAVDRQPGNLSLLATIQFAQDRGLKHVDFLRGDEPYKTHWRAQPTPCHDLRVWPAGWTGHVACTAHQARVAASVWLGRGPQAEKSADETLGK